MPRLSTVYIRHEAPGRYAVPQYPPNLWRRETGGAVSDGLTPRAGRPTVVSWDSPTPRRRPAGCLAGLLRGPKPSEAKGNYSHSIVAGGFDEMS